MATRPKNDKMGSISGAIPKLTPKPMPKKKAMGGPTGKPAPKYDKNGNRILSGTGSVTPNKRMPDLQKPGGIRDKAVTPAKPKKATPKAMPKFSAKMNQANPGKGSSVASVAKKVVSNLPAVLAARGAVKIGTTIGKAARNVVSPPKVEKKLMKSSRTYMTKGGLVRKTLKTNVPRKVK